MSEKAKAMGQRLQELRQQKGLSQSQFAKAAGVPVGSLRQWEQGRRLPMIDTAFLLAQALGLTLDELAGKVFEEQPKKKSRGKGRKPSDQ